MTCAKTELCIFDSAFPQVVVENAAFEEVFPLNTITGKSASDIEFSIIGSNTDYLDLNDTLLFVGIKVAKADSTDLVATDDCVPSDYLFHLLFRDIVLSLNNEKIEGGNNHYAHKALIETIINYNNDTKDTTLSSIGYVDSDAESKAWIVPTKVFNMCGSLQLDFFDQPKYLLPGVNVHLRLQRNKSSFCLKAATLKPLIEICDARLYIRRVKVEPSVLMGHQVGLNTRNAVYPIRKTELVSYTISKGSSSFYKDQIFGDLRLPKFILVTFQSNAQYNGSYTEDCSVFKNYDVKELTLSRNTEYRECYSVTFNDNYMTAYVMSIVRNMGHLDKNLNCGISPTEFKDKYPFFTFVLAPDFDVVTTQLPKQGNLRLDIKFGTALPESANVIIYAVFDSEIQINKNRTVLVN